MELTIFVQEPAGPFFHDLSFAFFWVFPKIAVQVPQKNTKNGWFISWKKIIKMDDLGVPITRWWFQIFFIFTTIWGRFPI